jgi:hypothetical protein
MKILIWLFLILEAFGVLSRSLERTTTTTTTTMDPFFFDDDGIVGNIGLGSITGGGSRFGGLGRIGT